MGVSAPATAGSLVAVDVGADSTSRSAVGPGILLGERYVIEGAVSSGSMGAVYRGHHRHSGEVVAIKRLIDEAQLTRFEIEARVLVQLKHERVVRVVDHFKDPLGYFLVMQYVDGDALDGVVRARGVPGLPVDEVLEYATQACEALDYVHRQRVVHRDVKPANLIVGEQGVVLVDFGVARKLGATSDGTLAVGTLAVGTPRFMAPEVFSGGVASERSDVFSLAVTITALITGEPPSYAERSPLRARFPEVPPEIEAALAAAASTCPNDGIDGRRVGRCAGTTAPDARRRLARAQHGRARCSAVDHRGRGSHRRGGVRRGGGLGRPDRRCQWRVGLPGGVGGGRAKKHRQCGPAEKGVAGRRPSVESAPPFPGPRGPRFATPWRRAPLYPEGCSSNPCAAPTARSVCFSSSIAATAALRGVKDLGERGCLQLAITALSRAPHILRGRMSLGTIVMKFGGTSVADAERLKRAAAAHRRPSARTGYRVVAVL